MIYWVYLPMEKLACSVRKGEGHLAKYRKSIDIRQKNIVSPNSTKIFYVSTKDIRTERSMLNIGRMFREGSHHMYIFIVLFKCRKKVPFLKWDVLKTYCINDFQNIFRFPESNIFYAFCKCLQSF
jgi:hypothetical protein